MYTIEHPHTIRRVILKNKDKKLLFFDKDYNLLLYRIKKDNPPILLQQVKTEGEIEKFYDDCLQGNNYRLSGRTLYKECIAYSLCCKAIQNTTKKDSLQKVRAAPIYEKLTPLEKGLIEKEIIEKTEKIMKSWFG
jgi:hypothetical protein